MFDLSLTAFDAAVLFVVGVSALLALARGAIREVLTMAVWIAAIVIAYSSFEAVRAPVLAALGNPWVADAATFGLVFLVPLAVLKIAVMLVAGMVPLGLFGVVDRILGGALGFLRGAFLVSAAYLALSLLISPPNQPDWIQQAALLPYVEDGAALIDRWLPPSFLAADLADQTAPLGDGVASDLLQQGGVGGPREPWPIE
jgi:membrane protein required for colicin V production